MRLSPRLLEALLFAGLSLFSPLSLLAAGEAFTDVTKAGPDLLLQGEYVGDTFGAQVIALGAGTFRVVGWKPGLPGAVGMAGKAFDATAQTTGQTVLIKGEGVTGAIENGTLTITIDGTRKRLKRVERTSPTLGAKPPENALVLFDGTSAEAWQGGKISPEGNLCFGTKSKQSFGDCSIHLEFILPFKPTGRGQDRGNSGVYVQDRYEVQVLDSFGLSGESNECGGIYNQHKPLVNMCYPPLQWQTYDIDFEGAKFDETGKRLHPARMTVRHNGVLVQDRVELSGSTQGGQKEEPGPGPIHLQNHGNPVFYRNIWVLPKP